MAEIGLRANAARRHLPSWDGRLTPHVLRHFCASQLYLNGMDLIAIQEALGHAWVATTMRYVHVHRDHLEREWTAAQQRAGAMLPGAVTRQVTASTAPQDAKITPAAQPVPPGTVGRSSRVAVYMVGSQASTWPTPGCCDREVSGAFAPSV
jgi:hypothetical protein